MRSMPLGQKSRKLEGPWVSDEIFKLSHQPCTAHFLSFLEIVRQTTHLEHKIYSVMNQSKASTHAATASISEICFPISRFYSKHLLFFIVLVFKCATINNTVMFCPFYRQIYGKYQVQHTQFCMHSVSSTYFELLGRSTLLFHVCIFLCI